MRGAFIFTMDALLALIPVFVILGTVTQVAPGYSSLELQSGFIGKEKNARDVLETQYHSGVIERNFCSMESFIEKTVTPEYNYSYSLSHKGTTLLNFSRGNESKAGNIVVARKVSAVDLEEILGSVSTDDEACYTFSFNTSNLTCHDYWFVGVGSNIGGTKVKTMDEEEDCDEVFEGGGDEGGSGCSSSPCKIKYPDNLVDDWSSNTEYHVYIRVAGSGTFYVIEALKGTPEEEISPEAGVRKSQVVATIKLWEEER